jgi:hypothetical protein
MGPFAGVLETHVDIDRKLLTSQESVPLPFGKLRCYADTAVLTSEQDVPATQDHCVS